MKNKNVIYREMGVYRCTSAENYAATIRDVHKVSKLEGFTSPQEIIDYFCKYCGCKSDDFTVIEGV